MSTQKINLTTDRLSNSVSDYILKLAGDIRIMRRGSTSQIDNITKVFATARDCKFNRHCKRKLLLKEQQVQSDRLFKEKKKSMKKIDSER